MISFKQYQKYEKIQPAYLRKLDFAYDDMEYWLEFAEIAKPLAVYRSKADMITHTKKLNKARRIKKDYQAWVKKIEKAESKPKSTKPKEAKTMARARKSTKKTYTKNRIKAILKRANKNYKRVHKKGKGKAVNTRFGYTASKGVYVYYLKGRK